MKSNTRHAMSYDERVMAYRREQGEYIHIDNMAGLLSSLMKGAEGAFPASQHDLHDEIIELRNFIETARCEIAGVKPNTLSKISIPGATDELDAIVEATREAADKILDAADEIQEIAGAATGDMIERMTNIATKIYEASSFQDITGQRVTKVVATLQLIETRLGRLAEAIGDDEIAEDQPEVEFDEDGIPIDPKNLLHGPELPADANAQDDIDALLASFD